MCISGKDKTPGSTAASGHAPRPHSGQLDRQGRASTPGTSRGATVASSTSYPPANMHKSKKYVHGASSKDTRSGGGGPSGRTSVNQVAGTTSGSLSMELSPQTQPAKHQPSKDRLAPKSAGGPSMANPAARSAQSFNSDVYFA
ncbi:hypothetical protein P389DRAFT_166851 [Cystobasidium minutum MCA 4210]|uniref:uncharacterized protein n=1 Tax=Cystobasidium minutum MCA 4210 TaxID=1397322 RepID=UPI0034CE8F4F|eukprot:jgi/Rhomi1/166851/fgenesh1_kg.2_\